MKRIILLTLVLVIVNLCFATETVPSKTAVTPDTSAIKKNEPLVTFVELGSVNCVPCKQMQPVMKAIEEKYGDQVKVVFHDVWKEDQKKFAKEFKIRIIPTQVFLDAAGKEFFRHEGFYAEKEIDKLVQEKGAKPKSETKE